MNSDQQAIKDNKKSLLRELKEYNRRQENAKGKHNRHSSNSNQGNRKQENGVSVSPTSPHPNPTKTLALRLKASKTEKNSENFCKTIIPP